MGSSLGNIILLFLAIIISAGVSWISIPIVKKIGLVDKPGTELHKIHKSPVPLAGGIALFASIFFFRLAFADEIRTDFNLYFLFGLAIIFATGVIDDIYILSPFKKISGQLIGSAFVILGGYSTTIFFGNPLDWLITIVWFTGTINAFNFLDGSDGLVLEIGITITGFLILFSQLSSQFELQTYSIVLLGILIGLLLFNARPAKMFMGDSGAQTLGLILAVFTLQYNPLGHDKYSSWITPIVMMAVPIFDVSLVVYSRVRRSHPIYRSGLDHTFHRLLQRGFSPRMANIILVIVTAATNLVAFGLLKTNRYLAYLILALCILGAGYLIYRLDRNYQPNLNG